MIPYVHKVRLGGKAINITSLFGANSTVTEPSSGDYTLTIKWSDIKSSLPEDGTPNSAEDWIAAILYYSLDNVANIGQSQRKIGLNLLQPSLGTWNGVRARIYQVGVQFYTDDTGSERPSPQSL